MSHFGRNKIPPSGGGWYRKVILHMKNHKKLVGNFSLVKSYMQFTISQLEAGKMKKW